MDQLNEILKNIRSSIEEFDELAIDDFRSNSECVKRLTCNLFYLEEYRVIHKEKYWNDYFSSIERSDAARDKEAQYKNKSLYLIKRTLHSGYKALDSMRSTITTFRKEK